MELDFVGQPVGRHPAAAAALVDLLADRRYRRLTMAVAWARLSGLLRIEDAIRDFQRAGGHVAAIVGIDEGGASVEGLCLLRELANDAYVFHDVGNRTFHPKLYLLEGRDDWAMIVGSSNLTRGGFYDNYEADLVLRAHADEQHLVRQDVLAYLDWLTGQAAACRPLTDDLINELARSLPGLITEERVRAGRYSVAQRNPARALFGDPVSGLPRAPNLPQGSGAETDESADRPYPRPDGAVQAQPSIARTWTKVLPASDAQRPPSAGTNPTGNLRLTKAQNDIDWRSFFRQELFGQANWIPVTRGHRTHQVAHIPFHVTVNGELLGLVELEIDYAQHRESGQANHTTVLHWGPELGETLRDADFTGGTITLSVSDDGTYSLILASRDA